MSYRFDQELIEGSINQPLLCVEEPPELPQLAGGESYEWAAIQNLDAFFVRVYRYWQEKGFTTLAVAGLLNICALAFTIAFSGFLLIFVNWGALHSECIIKDTCDITKVAVYADPLREKGLVWVLLAVVYLLVFGVYWTWTICHFVTDLVEMYEIRHFYSNKLGISDRQIGTMTWAEVVHRLVLLQRTMRLCIVRDLTEHDVVGRIMRKDNYFIAMINKGVLKLQPPLPGLRRRFALTTTLEWNLYFGVLDCMFDHDFQIRDDFLADPRRLRRRLKVLALANLAVAPFLLVFLLILFFMRNAERFYHHPASIGSRRWSGLAKWNFREFNELPHYLRQRLAASESAAQHYTAQFPSPCVAHVARFVAYVTGSFAALLLFVTLLDEKLLERPLFGRHLVWWAATLGVVLAVSRSFAPDDVVAPNPEKAMAEVVAHTHWLPRHWRGRAGSEEVQQQFQRLFQYRAVLLVEELASVVLTPFILYFTLPDCAEAITSFVRHSTARVAGVGDVCSYAAFAFDAHGNAKYGAPSHCPKEDRSRQGKMEKSLLTFSTTYPTWQPSASAKALLTNLASHTPTHANHLDSRLAASALMADSGAAGGGGALGGPRGGGLGPARRQHEQQGAACRLPHHLPMPQTGADGGSGLRRSRGASGGGSCLRSQLLASTVQHLGVAAFQSIHQAHCNGEGGGEGGHGSAARYESLPPMAVSISGLLPVNEEEELDARLVVGHSVLQNFYEERDDTVSHRLHSRAKTLHGLSPQLTELLAHGGAAADMV